MNSGAVLRERKRVDDTVFGGRVRGGDEIEKLQFQRERGGGCPYMRATQEEERLRRAHQPFSSAAKRAFTLSLSPPL